MAVINKQIAYMALPLSIRRGNPFPIDEYSVWYDKAEMDNYAQTSPVAYVGQILSLVNETETTVEAYMIQNTAGALIKLAATTNSGDLTEDILELQGKVSNLEASVGTKGEESTVTATDLWAAIDEVVAAYIAADAVIDGKFANYYNKTETDDKIDEKVSIAISSTYKPAGTIAFESLPALAATEEGKVYNVSNAFTTTENFVEGTGKSYPAGTNIVCIDVGENEFKWDVLSGFVDLSAYATTESLNTALGNKVDKVAGSSLVPDTDITKLQGLANIKTVAEGELALSEEGQLSVTAIDQSKVTDLSGALAGKVNAEEGKSLVSDELITKLTDSANIKDVSEEFNLDSGTGTLSVLAIGQDKITGLPEALEAKLTGVTVGATPLVPAEGIVTIPFATNVAAGVVISSAEENTVAVDGTGKMTVNTLNIDKVVQTPGTEIILNGGNAAPIVSE